MQNLILSSHLFDLTKVKEEYESRLKVPAPILDANNQETQESICARFRSYDTYERYVKVLS